MTDRCHRVRECEGGEPSAILERVLGDGGHRVRECEGDEIGATHERVLAYGGHPVWHYYVDNITMPDPDDLLALDNQSIGLLHVDSHYRTKKPEKRGAQTICVRGSVMMCENVLIRN